MCSVVNEVLPPLSSSGVDEKKHTQLLPNHHASKYVHEVDTKASFPVNTKNKYRHEN
jgi:hypothetical protein